MPAPAGPMFPAYISFLLRGASDAWGVLGRSCVRERARELACRTRSFARCSARALTS